MWFMYSCTLTNLPQIELSRCLKEIRISLYNIQRYWEAVVCWAKSHFYLLFLASAATEQSVTVQHLYVYLTISIRVCLCACKAGPGRTVAFCLPWLISSFSYWPITESMQTGPSLPDTTLIMASLETQSIMHLYWAVIISLMCQFPPHSSKVFILLFKLNCVMTRKERLLRKYGFLLRFFSHLFPV